MNKTETKQWYVPSTITDLRMDQNHRLVTPCAAGVLQEASGDTSPIPWNFAKFLVRKDGTVFGRSGIAQQFQRKYIFLRLPVMQGA